LVFSDELKTLLISAQLPTERVADSAPTEPVSARMSASAAETVQAADEDLGPGRRSSLTVAVPVAAIACVLAVTALFFARRRIVCRRRSWKPKT
jgi:ABC-type glycerol-3-phosphate transport system permease component